MSESTLRPGGPQRASQQESPARLRWWLALPAAAAGGLFMDLASPGLAWWPLMPVGVLLIVAAVWNQRAGMASMTGLVSGAAFWLPHIGWLTLYLGPVPWLALGTVMVLWCVLFGIASGLVTRSIAQWLFSRSDQRTQSQSRRDWLLATIAQAVAVTGLWVLREQLQGSWPYGGFPWGRVGHALASSPLAQSVSWLGFAGMTAAVVLACTLPVAFCFARGAGSQAAARRSTLQATAASLVLLLGLAIVPIAPIETTGTLRVAAVQGNSKSAIFDDRESGSVINDHIAATIALLDDLEASDDRVDVIVWPENSAEFDVRRNSANARRIERLAERAGAPIVIGSILGDEDGSYTNSTLVWEPDGSIGPRYDKNNPVPFAEYMPNRYFFRALAPDLVDLVQLEYSAGSRPSTIDIELDTTAGQVRAGLAICFDIIFDTQAVDLVAGGAQVIFAQTNNADFGRTDESAQQLEIARLRAIETGRTVVNISTVGTSAIISPSGQDIDSLPTHTAAAMVADVPLVSGETPALRFGALIAGFWMGVGGLSVAGAVTARIVTRATGPDAQRRKTRIR